MHMNYSRLWKLLADRNMTKADLMEITGISSRVIAKLSKNKAVTNDTIARICCALQCDVQEIMECVSDDSMSVYSAYRKYGKTVDENSLYKTVAFSKSGRPPAAPRFREHCGCRLPAGPAENPASLEEGTGFRSLLPEAALQASLSGIGGPRCLAGRRGPCVRAWR